MHMHFDNPVVIAAIVTAVGLIVSKVVEKINGAPTTPTYDKDSEVDALVSLIRHKYDCSRVSILGYHNGGHWIDNTSISKFTLRHESTNNTTTSLMPVMQGVGTTLLKEQPSILSKGQVIFEPSIDNEDDLLKPHYYETMRNFKTDATIAIPIHRKLWSWKTFSNKKQLVASFHMNWDKSPVPVSLLKEPTLRVELIKEIQKIIKSYCPKQVSSTDLLNNFMDVCNELQNKTQ